MFVNLGPPLTFFLSLAATVLRQTGHPLFIWMSVICSISVVSSLLHVRQPRLSFLTCVASEFLARFDVRVLLDARPILSDGPKDGRNHPTIVQSRVEQVPILVWIAAQVVEHRELWLDDGFIHSFRVTQYHLVDFPLHRHQLAVRSEEHVGIAPGGVTLAEHK